ncbi:hypothetical protein EMIT0P74_90089 [Pseudomonas sp. IT-P74]
MRTLGEKHLEKVRTVAAMLIALDIVGVGGQIDHRSCFDLKTGEATTASGAGKVAIVMINILTCKRIGRKQNGPAMQARFHGKVKK